MISNNSKSRKFGFKVTVSDPSRGEPPGGCLLVYRLVLPDLRVGLLVQADPNGPLRLVPHRVHLEEVPLLAAARSPLPLLEAHVRVKRDREHLLEVMVDLDL